MPVAPQQNENVRPYVPGEKLKPGETLIPGPNGSMVIKRDYSAPPPEQQPGQPIAPPPAAPKPEEEKPEEPRPYMPGQKLGEGETLMPGPGGTPVVISKPPPDIGALGPPQLKQPAPPYGLTPAQRELWEAAQQKIDSGVASGNIVISIGSGGKRTMLSDLPLYLQQEFKKGYKKGGMDEAYKYLSKASGEYSKYVENWNESLEAAQRKQEDDWNKWWKESTELAENYVKIAGDMYIKREDWEKLDKKYQNIAKVEGYDAMVLAMNTDEYEWRTTHFVIGDKALSLQDWCRLPEKYRYIAKESGFDAMMEKIAADYSEAEIKIKQQGEALSRLKDYRNDDGTYNFAKMASFARQNEDWRDMIKDANFDESDKFISDIQAYNGTNYGFDDFVSRYFMDRGWDELEWSQLSKYSLMFDVNLPKSEREDYAKFTEAREAYQEQYGTGTYVSEHFGKAFEIIFPPAKALRPEIELKDVSGLEWAIGVAQLALFAVPAVAAIPGAAGRVAVTGTWAAAGGIFTYDTVKYWGDMSNIQRVISVVIDTAIFAGAAASMAGIRARGQTAKFDKAANKSIDAVKSNLETPKSLELKAYDASYDLTKNTIKVAEELKNIDALGEKIENIAVNALRKAGYKAEDAARAAEKMADSLKTEISYQIRKAGVKIDSMDYLTDQAVRNALKKAGYKLEDVARTSARIADELKEGISHQVRKIGTKFDSMDYLTEQAVRNALKKAGYKLEDVARTSARIAEELKTEISYQVRKAGGRLGRLDYMLSDEALKRAVTNALKKAGYRAEDAARAAGRVADSLKGEISHQVRKMGVRLDSMDYLTQQAIRNALKKAGYRAEDAARVARKMADSLKTELSRQARKAGAKLDRIDYLLSDEAIEKAIAKLLKSMKYKKGKMGAVIKAILEGIKDAKNQTVKISPSALKKTLGDLLKALKNKDVEAVKQAGEELKAIGSRMPDEVGKVIARKGEFIVDKADEIVKIAEKRLKAGELSDLSDRLGTNQDFIASPTERAIGQAKFYDRAIGDIKRQIAKYESLLRNVEPRRETPKIQEPMRTKAEIEAEKVKISQELSRDNAKLYELENKGGEPMDINRLRNRIKDNYDRLFKLELESQAPGIDMERFREYIEGEIKILKDRLVELARRKVEITKGGKAEELWGIEVARGEEGRPLEPWREPFRPEDGRGGAKTRVKEKAKPKTEAKTAEELEKELMPEKERAKPKTEAKPKTKERAGTETERPVTLPRVKPGGKYIVLVWEHGRVYAKEVTPEELQEGYIEEISRGKVNPSIEERFKELSRTMTKEQAARVIAAEYPGKGNYPLIFPEPSPQTEGARPSPEPKPATQERPEPQPEPKPTPAPYPKPEPFPPPAPMPKPRPIPPSKTIVEEKTGRKILRLPRTDSEKRKIIKESGGMAVAYVRGYPRGKGMWHVWVRPKDGTELQRVILYGPAPKGARIEKGAHSAYRSIQHLFGKAAMRRVIMEDTGAVDTVIELGGKQPKISFERDIRLTAHPRRLTPKVPRITPKTPRITQKTPRIS